MMTATVVVEPPALTTLSLVDALSSSTGSSDGSGSGSTGDEEHSSRSRQQPLQQQQELLLLASWSALAQESVRKAEALLRKQRKRASSSDVLVSAASHASSDSNSSCTKTSTTSTSKNNSNSNTTTTTTTIHNNNNNHKSNVEEALRLYRLAVDTYQRLDSTTSTATTSTTTTTSNNDNNPRVAVASSYPIHRIGIANCWMAMGDVLASHTEDREQALVLYLQAEQVFKQAYYFLVQEQQHQHHDTQQTSTTTTPQTSTSTPQTASSGSNSGEEAIIMTTMNNKGDDDDNDECSRRSEKNSRGSIKAITTGDDSDVLMRIVEALSKRARVHADENAIGCHKEIVALLLDVIKNNNNKNTRENDGVLGGQDHGKTTTTATTITTITTATTTSGGKLLQQRHLFLLLQSLDSLGKLYRQYPERVDLEVFETALEVLRDHRKVLQQQRQGGQEGEEQVLLPLMGSILVTLARLYMDAEDDLEAAFEALDEALELLSPHDRTKAVQSMDAVGKAFEESQCYDQAIACYEKVLLIRSQLYGSNNILVAKSLINVGRVMELQGNLEGSLDLYRAAQTIYTSKLSDASVDVGEDDFKTLLELFPTAMEQGRYEEAVAYLSKCIEVAESESKPCDHLAMDKTYIFYNLGKAYIGLKDYVSATICLLEAAKYEGEVSEEVVFALLQRVEFLQREAAAHKHHQHDDATAGLPQPLLLSENKMVTQTIQNLTPLTSEISCGGSKSGEDSAANSDDEGTAYYDSESISVSVFDPMQKSDLSSSLFESDMLLSDALVDSLLDSDALGGDSVDRLHHLYHPHHLHRGSGGGGILMDVLPSTSELDGTHIEIPEGDSSLPLDIVEVDGEPYHANGIRRGGGVGSRTFSGFRLRLGSPRSRQDRTGTTRDSAAETNNNSSTIIISNNNVPHPRTSLAKTLTEKFRRQRRSGAGFQNENESLTLTDPLAQISLTPTSEGDTKSPSEVKSSLPSEEEYHSAIEGPVQYVVFRSTSFDSGISQITLRFDDPSRAKDTSQEWWWNVTTEGFARWFPSSVSKAVEAAEGFLSAKSIHSKVIKQAPLEYVSDEEDSVEEKASSGEEGILDHPSYAGVADSRTMLSGLDGKKARARIADARREAAHRMRSPKSDGALSVASGRPYRHPKYLEGEIARYSDLLDSQRAKYGKLHPEVATSMFTLAVLYSRNGAAAPAIEYAAEALGIQKATGKLDDASRSLHFLADMYLHQRQYGTALTFYTEALRLETKHYGEISDEAALTLNCIGTVYSLQNEFSNAMESHQEALRILNVVHDGDLKHPHVSETLCQIGSVYYRERNSFSKTQGLTEDHYTTFVETGMLETIGRAHEDRGSYKTAISFFEEKLQLMENRGPISSTDDLEEVATTLNSLGMLSSRAGFYVEAIDYYEKALKIQLKLGWDKVQLATARVLTGAVHFQLGDWQKALKLHQEALTVLRKELGTDHQTYAAALYQLAVVRVALCEFDTAMSLLKQALSIQTRLLGIDQPATLRTRREIANIYTLYQSSSTIGLEQLDAVLACQRLVHGDRHPNIAETLCSIGRAYSRAGDVSSAMQVLEECYYMRTEFLGWDHPQQASTLHEICQLHLKRGRTKKALHIINVVLGILRESLSDEHVDVALALGTKASCLIEEGKLEAASKALIEALKIAEEVVGPQHPALADLYVQMGTLQMRQCQFDDALSSIEKAVEIYKSSDVSDDYPGLLDALEKLDRVRRDEMLCV